MTSKRKLERVSGSETELKPCLDTQGTMTIIDSQKLSWHEYFMGFAIMAAFRSKDKQYQAGVCIANRDNRIISTGYNGYPNSYGYDARGNEVADWENCGRRPRYSSKEERIKPIYVCHAALNAIVNAKQDLRDSTLYGTRFPCPECAKLIVQSRIGKVYYLDEERAKGKELSSSSGGSTITEFQASTELFTFAQESLQKLKKLPKEFVFAEALPEFEESQHLKNLYGKLRRISIKQEVLKKK